MQYCPKIVERELNPEEIHYLRQLIAKECNNALSNRIKDLGDMIIFGKSLHYYTYYSQ